VLNENTGGAMEFHFDHSTGSEWCPTTKWIYKSKEGLELHVGNQEVTANQANAYLQAKIS